MSEIKTACRGTSRLIEVATMTHEEYLNLHTQGAKELRAAYEALQKENAELKATISNLTKAYDRESNDGLKALEERDYWYDKADSLADKISECFDVPIGEHSNVNCPIVEAMKILTGEYVTKFDKESAAQAKRIAELEAEAAKDHVKILRLKDALSAYGDPDIFADDED